MTAVTPKSLCNQNHKTLEQCVIVLGLLVYAIGCSEANNIGQGSGGIGLSGLTSVSTGRPKVVSRYEYAISERTKKGILDAAKFLRGVKPDDKAGLAQISDDLEKAARSVPTKTAPSAGLVHRYQLIDIQKVIDNIFAFAADVKHPPTQEELNSAIHHKQTKEEESLLDRFRGRVRRGIGTAHNYAKVISRYQNWCSQHRRLEEMDETVSSYVHVAMGEFVKVGAYIREEMSMPMSGASLGKQLEYERSLKPNRDFILEALTKTVERLEAKLIEEDTRKVLCNKPLPAKQSNSNALYDYKSKTQNYTSVVLGEAKNIIIKEARGMAKTLLFGLISRYVLSNSNLPYEEFMKYVGKLLGVMAVSSVKFAVECLRNENTRMALTVLNVFDPRPDMSSLIRDVIG